MTARRLFLLTVWLVSVSGCASPLRERMQAPSETVEPSPLLINKAVIDQKIAFLEGVLREKDMAREDRETAMAVLSAYKQLKEAASSPLGERDCHKLVLSLLNAVGLMDETYYGEEGIARIEGDGLARFLKERRAMVDLYLKGDYKGVIQEGRNLKTVFGPGAITPEIGLILALSLAKEGNVKEAIQVGEGISDELDRLPDGVELRARSAQWQLELGKRKRAREIYEGLVQKEDQRVALIGELGRQVGEIEREGEGGEAAAAEAEAEEAPGIPEEGVYTMDQLLQEVRSLVEAHDYAKARILILRERIRIGEGPELALLDAELQKIDQHESEFKGQTQAADDALKETREAARELIEREDYQAAIDSLNKAETSQELDAEARRLKEKAAEGLINKERNRAAELFLKARKTSDVSKKKDLLNSAYHILDGLIKTYPTSPMHQKLKSHMAVVQRELDSLK